MIGCDATWVLKRGPHFINAGNIRFIKIIQKVTDLQKVRIFFHILCLIFPDELEYQLSNARGKKSKQVIIMI